MRPRIGAGGISGIDTMFSGAYISADMAESGRPAKEICRTGSAAERRPVAHQADASFLHAEWGLDIGAPVYFRRIRVGRID